MCTDCYLCPISMKPGKRINVESKPGDILLTIQKLQLQPTPFVPQIEILIDEILIQDSCSSYDQSDVAEHSYKVSSPELCITFLFRWLCCTPHHHSGTVQSTYALIVLRAHRLCGQRVWDVARATAVAKLGYACSAWWVLADSGARSRIQALMSKLGPILVFHLEMFALYRFAMIRITIDSQQDPIQ